MTDSFSDAVLAGIQHVLEQVADQPVPLAVQVLNCDEYQIYKARGMNGVWAARALRAGVSRESVAAYFGEESLVADSGTKS